ncbi:NAD-dependent epimerase/dehydratase family protein [Cellulomonas sp. S1-8]|uniref:NAD-dependent epimerase/dehydratase family protein n=1 Tax=Cellulomonas sp. S1-8 TaxID=2904790 RepID=UPI00224461DB|nr:NAD-dependent epimerase/dehydratase family protein [Cellulomonas sp. S1-8]UZN01917.1 NAD-dependent epimerase/dehydratase family protein [Cellulomonas sp. S1-8]
MRPSPVYLSSLAAAARRARPLDVSVVGARGFIGSHVCRALEQRGHVVHTFDRSRPATGPQGVDEDILASDHVVWAASSINPMIAEHDPGRVALDIEAFTSFLDLLAQAPTRPRTVLLSSGGTVYDQSVEPPYAETSPVGPECAYGRAKLLIEQELMRAAPGSMILRVANAYGPGQPVAPGQGVISHWLHAAAAGQELHVFGDPRAARDYVHVDDLAEAVVRAVEVTDPAPHVLNVGSGRPTSLGTLLDVISDVVGADVVNVRHHPVRDFDGRTTWLDCAQATRTLGWVAGTSLDDGIRGTWASVVADRTASGGGDASATPVLPGPTVGTAS